MKIESVIETIHTNNPQVDFADLLAIRRALSEDTLELICGDLMVDGLELTIDNGTEDITYAMNGEVLAQFNVKELQSCKPVDYKAIAEKARLYSHYDFYGRRVVPENISHEIEEEFGVGVLYIAATDTWCVNKVINGYHGKTLARFTSAELYQ